MIMRFIVFCFFTMIFATTTLSAQEAVERRFKGGLVGGFNLSQIEGDDAAGYNKIGLQGGARVAIILKEKMDLGIELLFSQRGSAARNENQGRFAFKLTLNYIEVPVLFNYMDWQAEDEDYYRLHFHAGFSYGRLISFKTDEFSNLIILEDFIRDNDVSWMAGATYYINKNLGVTARYSRSLYPFFVPDETSPNAKPLIGYQLTFQTVYMF